MRTLIIAGGKFEYKFAVSFLEKNKYDYVIAVDRGIEYARKLSLKPDMWVGDFDSIRGDGYVNEYSDMLIEKHRPEKDETDTELAVNRAIAMGAHYDILCGTGGRLDHFFSIVHNLKLGLDGGVQGRILDPSNVIYLKGESFEISKEDCFGKYISFVPFGGEVRNLKLKGFKYTLDGYNLKPGVSRCISNEMAEDKAYISFDSGYLLVINSLDVESE